MPASAISLHVVKKSCDNHGSTALSQFLPEVSEGRKNDLKMPAVWAKTCRGAMTRFIIEHRIANPDDLRAFSYEGFNYDSTLGEADYPHFIRQ